MSTKHDYNLLGIKIFSISIYTRKKSIQSQFHRTSWKPGENIQYLLQVGNLCSISSHHTLKPTEVKQPAMSTKMTITTQTRTSTKAKQEEKKNVIIFSIPHFTMAKTELLHPKNWGA